MEDQPPDNNYQKEVRRGLAVLALIKLVFALFAWWAKDPDDPVKWGELRWVFLIEFMVLAYILYKLHWANYALFY